MYMQAIQLSQNKPDIMTKTHHKAFLPQTVSFMLLNCKIKLCQNYLRHPVTMCYCTLESSVPQRCVIKLYKLYYFC